MLGICNTSSTAEGCEDEKNVRDKSITNQVSEVLLLREEPVCFSEGESATTLSQFRTSMLRVNHSTGSNYLRQKKSNQ